MRSTLAVALLGASLASIASAAAAQAPGRPPAERPRPPAAKPEEVVVTGNRADVVARPDRLSFSVANDLQAQTGTLADALRNVPGVEVDLEGRVSLRGDSSVEILIDGRPSAMLRGEGRAAFLQSMPANQVERVEVITNPSAAFSPEGSGGIINLVTKRAQTNTRWATVRAIAGPDGKGGANVTGATSSKGLTLSGDLGFRRWPSSADFKRTREALAPDGTVVSRTRQVGDVDQRPVGMQSRVGAEYDLDKSNRLTGELAFHQMRGESERDETTLSTDPALGLFRDVESDIKMTMRSAKASWRRQFAAEHELVAELDLSRFTIDNDSDGRSQPAAAADRFEQIGNESRRDEGGFKLDYKRPLGEKSSLNLGYEVDLRRNEFDLSGAFGDSPETLLPVAALTNRFAYDELINAFYGTATFSLGKLELQPGLRLEQADLVIDQKTDELRIEDDYLRLYPTLHLGYEVSKADRLRASYSRRIARPSPQALNPYTVYIDPQNLRRGNPFLRPAVTDSFELGWNRRKGGTFLSATLFHRRSRDGFTEVVEDIGDGILLTTTANLAREKRSGVELIANGKFGKTLGYNASATLLHHEIDSAGTGFAGKRSGTVGNGRLSLTWQPTPKDFFQLGGIYIGRQLLPQGYRQSGGMLNLGYRRKVSDKLSLLLTGQNLLDSLRQETVIESDAFRDRITSRGPGRTVLAGITLNFGNSNRRRQDQGIEFDQGAGNVPQ
ncbi:MAG TPA: outer membrane beta-barrel family protein [Sphingomicrobium sp.]|nr:outer membrane beta-barrel family protein [Sphingomicrobium sp.]